MSKYDKEDRATSMLQMYNRVIKKKKITTKRKLKDTAKIPKDVGTHTKDRLDAFPSMSFGSDGFARSAAAGNDKLQGNAPQPVDAY